MIKQWLCIAAIGLTASAAIAQNPGEGRKPKHGAQTRPADGGQRPLDRMAKEFNLTEEQKVKVQQIFQTQRQALENWRKENGDKLRELLQKMREANEAKDTAALQKIRDELQKLTASRAALHENLLKQLGDVLTPEQMEKAKVILAQDMQKGQRLGQFLDAVRKLNLTPEQRDKIAQVAKETQAAIEKAQSPEEKGKIAGEAFKKINDEVLTDAQREQLKKILQERQHRQPEGKAPKGPRPRQPGAKDGNRPAKGDRPNKESRPAQE